jgi:phosphomannomutase/phosphoglucomutase
MSLESPVRKRRLREATKRNLIIAAAALAGLILIAVALWWMVASLSERAAKKEAAAQEIVAAQVAAAFSASLKAARADVARAAAMPDLPQLLAAGDAEALGATAAAASATLPGILRLRLLPLDGINIDDEPLAPLTYASLDLLTRARNATAPVPAEVHLPGSDREHVVFVELVRDGSGAVVGFVHAAYPVEFVTKALGAAAPKGRYVELHQTALKGNPIRVARANGASPPAGPSTDKAIPETAWLLRIWPGKGVAAVAASEETEITIPWLPLLAALALSGAAVAWFRNRRRGGAFGFGDATVYQGAVRAIMDGAHPGLERLVPGLQAPGDSTSTTVPAPVADELEGEDITAVARAPAKSAPTAAATAAATGSIDGFFVDGRPADSGIKVSIVPDAIFRKYDIRGVVGDTLTADIVYEIGRAIGSEAYQRGQQGLVVGRDGRQSSPELAEALIRGLLDSGRDVIDIGLAPTPVLYFATHYLDTTSGVMVTGSHNPSQYNGLKIVLDGEALSGAAITAIRERIENGDFTSGAGTQQSAEIVPEYIRRVTDDIPVALSNPLKIVVDCGNAVAGTVAPHLLRALGHDVIELYCDVDGSFPNHHPDPSQPENLEDLIDMVKLENADLGLAFDGDGDRLGVIDGDGNILWPDRQLMLFARDVLSRNPGAQVIFDVKCSRALAQVITEAGGEPLMWKTGHSLIKAKMRETGALLAGEMSGHIFFKERWYGFDDALYAAARLVEILVGAGKAPTEVFKALPGWIATPELRIDLAESEHDRFMEKLAGSARIEGAELSMIDGIRADYADGWGLIRPSNTTPCLVLRFEAKDAKALARIQAEFRGLIQATDASLKIPF